MLSTVPSLLAFPRTLHSGSPFTVMWSESGETGAEARNVFIIRGDRRKLPKGEEGLEKPQANHGRGGFPAVGGPGWKGPGGPERALRLRKAWG